VGGEEQVDEGVSWLLHFLGENFSDSFTAVACKLGLLIAPKVMDAESACAMWEEANCPVRVQRIILQHLAMFFGRRITVPAEQTFVSSKMVHFYLLLIQLFLITTRSISGTNELMMPFYIN
jgi:hypothetical protein